MSMFDMTEAPASLDLINIPHPDSGSIFTGSVEPDSLYLTPQVMHPTSALLTPPELTHSPPPTLDTDTMKELIPVYPKSSRSPRKSRRLPDDVKPIPSVSSATSQDGDALSVSKNKVKLKCRSDDRSVRDNGGNGRISPNVKRDTTFGQFDNDD